MFFVFIIFPSKRRVSLVYFIIKSANKVYMTLVFLPHFGADAVLLGYLEQAFYQNSRKLSLCAESGCPRRITAWAETSWSKRVAETSQESAEARGTTHFTSLFFFFFLALALDSFYTIWNAQVSWASDSKCKIGSFLELEIWLNLNVC